MLVAFLALGGTPALAQDAYVANLGSNDVSVIDTQTNQVVGPPIAVGTKPESIAITPDSREAYVADFGSEDVSVIDTETNAVVATIGVGREPVAIAITPDGKRAYVVDTGSEEVSVIDTQTNQVTASIRVKQSPWGIAISPDGRKAYVNNEKGESVSVIDIETNKLLGGSIGVGKAPVPIEITPDGHAAYVANYQENDVSVIDTETNKPLASPIGVGVEPWGIAIAPDGKRLYVANEGEKSVSVIDTETNRVLGAPIGVGTQPYVVAITPNGKSAYVANFGSESVSLIDTENNQVVGAPIRVGKEPAAIAIPPAQAPHVSFSTSGAKAGEPVAFEAAGSTDPGDSIASYDWEFGDGSHLLNGGPSPTHRYKYPGPYRATVTVTDSEGCSTRSIFTGQTAYCNGSALASQTRRVMIAYPGVLARCPSRAGAGGCTIELQALTRRRIGQAESAVSRVRLKAGSSAIVSLKPKIAYRAKLISAARVLVRETVKIDRAERTLFRRLKVLR